MQLDNASAGKNAAAKCINVISICENNDASLRLSQKTPANLQVICILLR